VNAINRLYFPENVHTFRLWNAFCWNASRAGADVLNETGMFRYHVYVQAVWSTLYFDYGYRPFLDWCCSMIRRSGIWAKSDSI
jgi:hypothetical protein